MAARGGVRDAPYPAAVVLGRFLDDPETWWAFDGWCAAKGVAPLALPSGRYLNLVYFYLASEFKDGAQIVDNAVAEATAGWTRVRQQAAVRQARLAPAPEPEPGAATGRRLPPPPDWWKGDEDAMRSALVAQQQLRQGGR